MHCEIGYTQYPVSNNPPVMLTIPSHCCTLRLHKVVRVGVELCSITWLSREGSLAHTWRTPPAAEPLHCHPFFPHCNLTVAPPTLPSAPEYPSVHSQASQRDTQGMVQHSKGCLKLLPHCTTLRHVNLRLQGWTPSGPIQTTHWLERM